MGISVNDSKLAELSRLIAGWPGLASAAPEGLIEDCLVLVDHLGDARTIVDVGSGGGLPGLPLKIVRPDLEVTLLEADGRKSAFLVRACAQLGLRGVKVVNRRAEDAAHEAQLRERFDLAVAWALAPMPVLAELCLPFVRVGGRLLAMKGQVEEAAVAIATMGGGPAVVRLAPSAARERGVVVAVPKVAPTPSEYPRRPGMPN